MEPINPTERAIIEMVRETTNLQLRKRVPDIDHIDYRRLAFLIVQTRIDAYKAAGVKQALVLTLAECGITTTAYYAWYEKYNRVYEQYTQSRGKTIYKM